MRCEMRLNPGDKFLSSHLLIGGTAILKTDGIGWISSAKEDADGIAAGFVLGTVRLTEDIGIIDLIAPVTRAGKHALISRDPVDTVACKQGNHTLAYSSFRRPHAR